MNGKVGGARNGHAHRTCRLTCTMDETKKAYLDVLSLGLVIQHVSDVSNVQFLGSRSFVDAGSGDADGPWSVPYGHFHVVIMG